MLRADFKEKNKERDYEPEKLRLGNLTLPEKPLNIIAGNDFFALKKAKYVECGSYLTPSLVRLADGGQNTSISRINAKLAEFEGWNAENIDKRQEFLTALAKEIWSITPIEG